jgi:ParB-like nuclease domain
MMRGEGYHNTTEEREEALTDAESRLIREGHTPTVFLRPRQIKTMPELFQPRMLSYDGRATSEDHVKVLVDAIKIDGKIEPPPLVIKLRSKGFVIVDGHHTLAAYRKVKEHEEIECEWFDGTARQAWDEALRRNRKDKLPMHKDDKSQAAWERVLIGGWTAAQIKAATGISVRTVRRMGKVKKAARRGGRFQRALIENVSGMQRDITDDTGAVAIECLKRISWRRAWLLYAGVGDREISDEEDAVRLLRKLRGNVPDKLMMKPRVIALALKLYDESLPGELTAAWEDLKDHPEALEEARGAYRRAAERYQERVAKEAAWAATAEQERKDMERVKRLEEDAKARNSAGDQQDGRGALLRTLRGARGGAENSRGQ